MDSHKDEVEEILVLGFDWDPRIACLHLYRQHSQGRLSGGLDRCHLVGEPQAGCHGGGCRRVDRCSGGRQGALGRDRDDIMVVVEAGESLFEVADEAALLLSEFLRLL